MKIVTNNKPRNIVSFFELKNKHRKEMLDKFGNDVEGMRFFVYKDNVYCLSDFCINHKFGKHWDGAYNYSFYSAVLIRYAHAGSAVIVGIAHVRKLVRCYTSR